MGGKKKGEGEIKVEGGKRGEKERKKEKQIYHQLKNQNHWRKETCLIESVNFLLHPITVRFEVKVLN